MAQQKETLSSNFGNHKDGFDLEKVVKEQGWLKKLLSEGTAQQIDGLVFEMRFDDESLCSLMEYEYGNSQKSAKPWMEELKGDLRMTLAGIVIEPRLGVVDRLARGEKFETVMEYMRKRMEKDFSKTAEMKFEALGLPKPDELSKGIMINWIKGDAAKNIKVRDLKSGNSAGEYS